MFPILFILSARGGGRGSPRRRGGPRRGGGGFSRTGGAEGPGGCLQRNWGISGGGLNIFFRGRNVHQLTHDEDGCAYLSMSARSVHEVSSVQVHGMLDDGASVNVKVGT